MIRPLHPEFQSPFLYLQAAGSTGDDGTAYGIHLRWALRGILRANHLPKGDLASTAYPTSILYNRPDDYVYVYRARYAEQFPVVVQLFNPPTRKQESGVDRYWEYDIRMPNGALRTVQLRFTDVVAYDNLRATQPKLQHGDFLFAYDEVWELEILGHLCFQVDLRELAYPSPSAQIELESISLADRDDADSAYCSCRHRISKDPQTGIVEGDTSTICEQIKYMRLRHRGAEIFALTMHTYEDTVRGYDALGQWNLIGKYSLSENDAEVARRLEDPPQVTVDRSWPKYNDVDPVTGAFTVNIDNYLDRWLPAINPQDGLKEGVLKYLELSRTDPQALEATPDATGDSETELGYLQLLQLAALDYHIARMLGLGIIDPSIGGSDDPYLYLAEYVTEADLGPDYPALHRTHYYMSLPSSALDERLPPPPKLQPVQYGLFVDNGTQTPTRITGPDGYVPADNGPFDYVRFVNIYKDLFDYERPLEPFFASSRLFCTCQQTMPVLFGLEYRALGEPIYRQPELLHDATYADHAGIPESVAIPENGSLILPIYTHRETEEGIHEYRLYSINWFARTSDLSNSIRTDETRFPVRASLRPPDNLAVQLIQPEHPRLFTTADEQARLASMPDTSDRTLVRLTFEWNHLHNIEYQTAKQAQVFFRADAPKVIQGMITALSDLGDTEVEVQTGPLPVTSATPSYDILPYVSSADATRFEGSLMLIDQQPYEVLQVMSSGNNPSFRLRKRRDSTISDPEGDEAFLISESYQSPPVDAAFLVYEQLGEPSSWDFALGKRITLVSFSPTHTETSTLADGQTRTLTVGGLFGAADIEELPAVYAADDPAVTANPNQPPFAGDPIPGSGSGVFTVAFRSTDLPDHPDSDVEWYKGSVRIMEDASLFPASGDPTYRPPRMKVLSIASIEQQRPLRLVVMDPAYDPNSTFTNPQTEYMPIATGTGVNVNAHPGYRVYLLADDAGGRSFHESTLLPAPGQGKKTTYLGIQAVDTSPNPDLLSSVRGPAPLLALEINPPVAPGIPEGAMYATRPDVYGKATYTFDVEVDTSGGRSPYALVFYRAGEQKILDTLYRPETVADVRANLNSLLEHEGIFYVNRWSDLVNVDYDPATHTFRAYVPDGYRFPLPDNDAYRIPNADPAIDDRPFDGTRNFGDTFTKTRYLKPDGTPVTETLPFAEVVAEAIQGAFLPLTEQPMLYKYIKTGRQTSKRRPLIRDASGDLIFPEGTIDWDTFDPFPMTVRFTENGVDKVRFTDYTLDGAATAYYFYFGVELSDRMEVSNASPVAGPIELVNTMPAEPPVIKQIRSKVANPLRDEPAHITLSIEPYLPSEGIRQIQIYRATNATDASTIRRMQLAATLAIDEPLEDRFTDLSVPPYGEALFYRLVALREIRNERDELEYVPSKPSPIALSSIVDTQVPEAPTLAYVSDAPLIGPPATLPNVRLLWEKTVHHGAYHLYKMQAGGSWKLIHSLTSNDENLEVALSATALGAADLIKENDQGQTLYHHFKVVSENSSGILSREERRLTI